MRATTRPQGVRPWAVYLVLDISSVGAGMGAPFTGIPMILYEPRASLIGWLVLMIFVSPFLQLLTTLFSAHVTWLWMLRRQALSGDA